MPSGTLSLTPVVPSWASRSRLGVCAASRDVRPPRAATGHPDAPSTMSTTYFMVRSLYAVSMRTCARTVRYRLRRAPKRRRAGGRRLARRQPRPGCPRARLCGGGAPHGRTGLRGHGGGGRSARRGASLCGPHELRVPAARAQRPWRGAGTAPAPRRGAAPEGRLYLHTGPGRKQRALGDNPRVCISVIAEEKLELGPTPCDDGYLYQSVILEGRAAAAHRRGRARSARSGLIVAKYDPEAVAKPFKPAIFRQDAHVRGRGGDHRLQGAPQAPLDTAEADMRACVPRNALYDCAWFLYAKWYRN